MNTQAIQAARYDLFAGAMQVENVDILTRTRKYMERLVKKIYAEEEVEYITKEEQLAMIRQGLLEVKEMQKKGLDNAKTLEDLIDEL